MNPKEMRRYCYKCSGYRLINYASGDSEIGCVEASTDGYPVPVRQMNKCPKGYNAKGIRPVDKLSVLQLLGYIYSVTAVGPARLALQTEIARVPTLSGRKSLASGALQKVCVEKVATTSHGVKGIACTYRWKAGPPSLEMAEEVIHELHVLTSEQVAKRRLVRKGIVPPASRRPKIEPEMIGVTSCAKCRLREMKDCRDKLLELGYNCKKINVNKLSDEIIMGLKDSRG